ncbi:hypothetical protein ACWDUD_21640 [Rhodococcus sp. NPDC003382]
MKDSRYQMNSQTKRGSVVPRSRWWRQCVVAGTTVVMVAVGGSAALAQPASTTPTPSPAPVTTTAPATSDVVPAPALTEDTADPCAVPTTATVTTTTAPPVTTTTTAPAPPCDPATTPVAPEPVGPETAAASESAPAPEQPPVAPAQDTVAPAAETVAPLPAELMPTAPAADQPVAPDDPELSSKTAEPDLDWRPTENPKSTIVPGQMRSDREEVPAPFTKEDADKAEMLEAQQRSTSGTSRMSLLATCQTYWPSPYSVCGDIRDKYNSLGGPASFLSFPTSGNIVNPGNTGERVTFLNGPIYWSAATGAHPVVNSFLNRWGIHGYEAATGMLGYPTTDEIVHADGVGRRQEFQRGAIYVAFQNAIGSAIRNGLIRDRWNAVGAHEPGSLLGYPIQDPVDLPDGQGRMSRFERGVIYWHPTTGAWDVSGAILDKWAQSGYEAGQQKYPTGQPYSTDGDVTLQQNFQAGSITVPGPKAQELALWNPGATADDIVQEAQRLATELSLTITDVVNMGLTEIAGAAEGLGDPDPGVDTIMPTPRGPGDIFYSKAATARVSHGHNGIFATMTHSVEANNNNGVYIIDNTTGGGRIMKSPEMFWVDTSSSMRQSAIDFALSKIGLGYNAQFWSNKVVDAVAYNCSALVWAAFYGPSNGAVDLDADGGLGVWPLDIKHSPLAIPYP